MATDKLVNILGGGLLSASIVILILWATYSPPHYYTGPIPLIATETGTLALLGALFLFSGFMLSIVTPNGEVERLYPGFGLFLGILLVALGAGYAAWEMMRVAETVMPVMGSTYRFPSPPEAFLTFLVADAAALLAGTIAGSVGYALGSVAKGAFQAIRNLSHSPAK